MRSLGRMLVVSLLSGGFGSLGLAPHGFWLATVFSLALTFFFFSRITTGARAFWLGWVYGSGYFVVALIWIMEPFFVEPEIYGWMAPFALLLTAGGLALFWAAAFRLAFALPYRSAFVLTLTWGLLELARANLFTGFPWAAHSQIWLGHGPDLLLGWIGPHGLSLLTLWAGYAIYFLFSYSQPLWLRSAPSLFIALSLGYGFIHLWSLPDVEFSDKTVRIVQPNAPQDEKWDVEKAPLFFARQIEATRMGATRPDLIIWPETSLFKTLGNATDLLLQMKQAAMGSIVVFGANRNEENKYYNSLVVLDQNGEISDIYDKHHLVPFGEYLPFSNLFNAFGIRGIAEWIDGGYAAGSGPNLISISHMGTMIPLICYEAIFSRYSMTKGERPEFLLQITNDAWFGTYSGPYQHFAQARMRAIEQGLPMIRSANTGVSAMIDPYGRILAKIDLDQHGFVDVGLPKANHPTLYSRTGDWPIVLLYLISILYLIIKQYRTLTLK
ncbi:MAG: apolipoprotein N-acyltransferase [Aestuariivita sp.]|nr:apolipoprotein N-acyltransferase [Aestuariivita sp.]